MFELKDNDLLFAKVKPNAIIPTKEKENAGYDIYACFDEDFIVIPAHETRLIPTGIAAAVSDKYYLQVHERGSTGSKGMKYGAGVVDSSYRGEIFVCINNVNDNDIVISKLNEKELIKKYAKSSDDLFVFDDDEVVLEIEYNGNEKYVNKIYIINGKFESTIIYPYEKAIAQLVVHEVPVMDVQEITYEDLLKIPSKRGTGALGSSGKQKKVVILLEDFNNSDLKNRILKQTDLYEILPFKETKSKQLIKSGQLPLVKIGNDYITTFNILEEWIRSHIGDEIFFQI